MSGSTQQQLVDALLARHRRTYAEEVGVDVGRNSPSHLFCLFCLTLLLRAPLQAGVAVAAASALADHLAAVATALVRLERARYDTVREAGS